MNVYQLSAKNCMSHLLLKDTFDNFSFIEGEITTFNKFTISGFLQEDFFDEKPANYLVLESIFDEKPEENYSRWKKTRDFCFQIIRGKRTPLGFKIVLALPEDQIPDFLTAHGLTGYRPEEIRGLYLNFHYDGHHLQCITGTSLNTFTMDKSIEREWDQGDILKSRSIEGNY